MNKEKAKMFDKEKREFGAWWIWVGVLGVGSIIVLTFLSYAGILGRTVVERKVFENSFQYSEARKTEIATFEAQLAELESQLLGEIIDPQVKQNLEASAAGIRVQLQIARRR